MATLAVTSVSSPRYHKGLSEIIDLDVAEAALSATAPSMLTVIRTS
jgi:hypothetical protein